MKKHIPSEYDKQAEDFMKKYGLTMKAEMAVPQQAPLWAKDGEKHGIQWSIELSRATMGKGSTTIQFFFWTSIKDKEDIDQENRNSGRHYNYPAPRPYSVLSGLWTDTDDGFSEFCSSLGYDEDSRLAEQTYTECVTLNKKIRSILFPEAIEELKEIQ